VASYEHGSEHTSSVKGKKFLDSHVTVGSLFHGVS
jgi:hypothetical protein